MDTTELPEIAAHRFSVECADCDALDTYGYGEEWVEIGRKHADETGHRVVVYGRYWFEFSAR